MNKAHGLSFYTEEAYVPVPALPNRDVAPPAAGAAVLDPNSDGVDDAGAAAVAESGRCSTKIQKLELCRLEIKGINTCSVHRTLNQAVTFLSSFSLYIHIRNHCNLYSARTSVHKQLFQRSPMLV